MSHQSGGRCFRPADRSWARSGSTPMRLIAGHASRHWGLLPLPVPSGHCAGEASGATWLGGDTAGVIGGERRQQSGRLPAVRQPVCGEPSRPFGVTPTRGESRPAPADRRWSTRANAAGCRRAWCIVNPMPIRWFATPRIGSACTSGRPMRGAGVARTNVEATSQVGNRLDVDRMRAELAD